MKCNCPLFIDTFEKAALLKCTAAFLVYYELLLMCYTLLGIAAVGLASLQCACNFLYCSVLGIAAVVLASLQWVCNFLYCSGLVIPTSMRFPLWKMVRAMVCTSVAVSAFTAASYPST